MQLTEQQFKTLVRAATMARAWIEEAHVDGYDQPADNTLAALKEAIAIADQVTYA